MSNPQKYGSPPYKIALIHGGPGAAGEMQPVAIMLQSEFSLLEPYQTATTLSGQVEELAGQTRNHGEPPMTLVGFSWGAWLCWITAAHHPELVRKLVLIGAGPFDARYAPLIIENRLERLSIGDKAEFLTLLEVLEDPHTTETDKLFARLGELARKADHYDPIEPAKKPPVENPYYRVLEEALKLRETGELLALGERIRCPVVAIHGEVDPHPVAGVEGPLKQVIEVFRCITIPRCGHKPWIERQAKDTFYELLRTSLTG